MRVEVRSYPAEKYLENFFVLFFVLAKRFSISLFFSFTPKCPHSSAVLAYFDPRSFSSSIVSCSFKCSNDWRTGETPQSMRKLLGLILILNTQDVLFYLSTGDKHMLTPKVTATQHCYIVKYMKLLWYIANHIGALNDTSYAEGGMRERLPLPGKI